MIPLVFLPGMMCDARLFEPQISAFSGAHDIFLPQIGQQASIGELARDVLSRAPARFALCGLSMGGIIAMEILRQAPERVDRIALLDTNPLAEEDEVKIRRLAQMTAVREGHLAEIMRNDLKPKYLANTPARGEILDLCMDMALALGPHTFLRQSRALMDRSDQSETLMRANLPALVLCGREDRVCSVKKPELMANMLSGSQLEIIENAGHLPTLEQPQQTNAALARWLEA
jgi:pimeloyl-ACP methyl ester carboxylesterase